MIILKARVFACMAISVGHVIYRPFPFQAVPRLAARLRHTSRPCRAFGAATAMPGRAAPLGLLVNAHRKHKAVHCQSSLLAAKQRRRLLEAPGRSRHSRGSRCLACPAPRRALVRRRCGRNPRPRSARRVSGSGCGLVLVSRRAQALNRRLPLPLVLRLSFCPLLGSRCCVPSCVVCQRRRWRNVSIEFGQPRLAQAAHGAPSAACLRARQTLRVWRSPPERNGQPLTRRRTARRWKHQAWRRRPAHSRGDDPPHVPRVG